jgi:acyl dehydratase
MSTLVSGPIFDSVGVGDELPPLVKGPMSPLHIMRWSAAIENWHRIHYDWRFATEHDSLPDVVVNGTWKQHVFVELLSRWAGDTGWVWKLALRFVDTDTAGATLIGNGKVIAKEARGEFGVVDVELALRNQHGTVGTVGTGRIVLPRAGGPAVPYPFDPAVLDRGALA